jgi:acyl-CoA reductase-like NAD-dependent aldehyde dehydrogenase
VMLSVWKIAPALRAGNTMVLKPSPYTPLTVLALGELFRPVLPPGVLNVVTGPEPLGRRVIAHPVPSKVAFTGSTATGRRVGAAAIADLKRVTLELGGNDAAVVLDDAEPERFSESVFWGAMRNNGQLCLALKRLYVPARRHAAWVEALAARAERTRVGDGRDAGTELGPVGNAAQHRRVQDLVEAAVRDGATVAAGGRSLDRAGYFYAPTILADVTDAMRVVREEQFGPVLPVLAYDDVDEAVERANASDYGLTGSVWSDDEEHAAAIAARLRCGQVSINVHGGAVRPDTPFHGFRHSGIGVENGRAGLDAYTELQAIARSG